MSRKAKEIYEAGGKYYPVDGYIKSKAGAVVPLVGIPQMSDRKWQKAAERNAVDNYTGEHGKPPGSTESHRNHLKLPLNGSAKSARNREHKKGESTCTSQSANRSKRLRSSRSMS